MKRTLLALLVLAGCGGDERGSGYTKTVMKLDDVPANIRKIAADDLGDSKLLDAFRKTKKDGTFVSYEIRAKNPKTGKINEVGISPEGKILERD